MMSSLRDTDPHFIKQTDQLIDHENNSYSQMDSVLFGVDLMLTVILT